MRNGKPLTKAKTNHSSAAKDSSRFNDCSYGGFEPHRCLVVDDNGTVMRLVAAMLTGLGHQVDLAENSIRAIKKIADRAYDLVVTDLEMPQMNGHQLASIVKRNCADTKTVIMTGRCHAEVADLTSSAFVDAWLFKPFGLNELCRMLNSLAIPNQLYPEQVKNGGRVSVRTNFRSRLFKNAAEHEMHKQTETAEENQR